MKPAPAAAQLRGSLTQYLTTTKALRGDTLRAEEPKEGHTPPGRHASPSVTREQSMAPTVSVGAID
ncbi:hypothetical protein AMK33_04320 [Streptomyces sp. CB02400]|nr:hypothetical protein AMK33_04320 [Streptomyces sp. CB02400]